MKYVLYRKLIKLQNFSKIYLVIFQKHVPKKANIKKHVPKSANNKIHSACNPLKLYICYDYVQFMVNGISKY